MAGRQDFGVLLVDAAERSAVAACAALALAGYRVATAASQWPPPAGWSRFSEARFFLPNPRNESLRFAERVAAIAREGGYQTVLACSEGSLRALSEHREPFAAADVSLGLPDATTVARCVDKAELIARAGDAGLTAPETAMCADREEARAAADRFGLPVVVKPIRTVFEIDGETRHLASAVVVDRRALENQLDLAGFPCLVQRREVGPVVSFAGVFAQGRLMASASSRYLRTWPPAAGPVSCARSFLPEPSTLAAVGSLVSSLGWEGLFELEAIERGQGDYAVLDFNPRIYGSLALAVKGGAPLPVVWCDWLLKGKSSDLTARPGVYYRWEDAEIRNAAYYLRHGKLRQALSVVRPRREVAHAYFRWSDPLPFLVRMLPRLTALQRRS